MGRQEKALDHRPCSRLTALNVDLRARCCCNSPEALEDDPMKHTRCVNAIDEFIKTGCRVTIVQLT